MNITTWIEIIGAAVFILVGVLAGGWYRILKETNKLLREQNDELKKQNDALKEENKEWLAKHIQNEKAISELNGKIHTLTTVPMADIAQSLKELNISNKKSAENTKKTFEILKKSALIAEKDKKSLFSQNIKEQHVKHQTVETETVEHKEEQS